MTLFVNLVHDLCKNYQFKICGPKTYPAPLSSEMMFLQSAATVSKIFGILLSSFILSFMWQYRRWYKETGY